MKKSLLIIALMLSIQACSTESDLPEEFEILKDYHSEDPAQCETMRIACSPGTKVFFDEDGCGCIGPKDADLREQEKDNITCGGSYAPVCGKLQSSCEEGEDCESVLQTFGNECFAKRAGASDIVEGKCEDLEIDSSTAL